MMAEQGVDSARGRTARGRGGRITKGDVHRRRRGAAPAPRQRGAAAG